jgi:nickel superoxide dismutase
MKQNPVRLLCFLVASFSLTNVWAHCQIPCGIYTDSMRFDMIDEHIATIEKSMQQINELSAAEPVNYNQLVRWINNKDQHAQEIQDIVDHYFMTQRVKSVPEDDGGYDDYIASLKLLHGMLVSAMKCKQTVDPTHVEALRKLNADYKALYFKDHGHTPE